MDPVSGAAGYKEGARRTPKTVKVADLMHGEALRRRGIGTLLKKVQVASKVGLDTYVEVLAVISAIECSSASRCLSNSVTSAATRLSLSA
jgi:hypothetical protein